MFLIRLVVLPVRVALGSLVVGYKVGSLLGYRRLLTFAVGLGVGLLLAPVPGRELRARLQQAIDGRGSAASGADLSDRVREELARSPRTWHLPQPQVEATGGTVTLRGEVPHDLGRSDLERTAAAVTGVVAVDNLLVVAAVDEAHVGGPTTGGQGTSTAG
jgi:hypothetical protein